MTGIMFHYFHGKDNNRCQGSIGADDFERIILRLMKSESVYDAKTFMSKKDGICLTFDDGMKSQFNVALPILNKYGIKAFFFINTSPIVGIPTTTGLFQYYRSTFPSVNSFYDKFYEAISNSEYAEIVAEGVLTYDNQYAEHSFYTLEDRIFRYVRDCILGKNRYDKIMYSMIGDVENIIDKIWMNREQIYWLHSEGHVIGLHSHTHPNNMAKLSYEEQFTEYRTNLNIIKDIIGETPTTASYPSNSYNDSTLGIMDYLGITTAFIADTSLVNGNPNLLIPRIDCALL